MRRYFLRTLGLLLGRDGIACGGTKASDFATTTPIQKNMNQGQAFDC
jgi:hypothetical protein